MLKPLSTFLILRGILTVALGIMALVWPGVTVFTLVVLFAVTAFIAAGVQAFLAFGSADGRPVSIGLRQNWNARPSVVPQRKAA